MAKKQKASYSYYDNAQVGGNGDYFEPSTGTKKKWLFTKKNNFDVYFGKKEKTMPGFFGTYDLKTNILLFWVVVAFELIGIWVLLDAFNYSSFLFKWLVPAFFADFLLVIVSHFPFRASIMKKEVESYILNIRKYFFPSYPKENFIDHKTGKEFFPAFQNISYENSKINRQIFFMKVIPFIFKIAIVFIALTKIWAFTNIYGGMLQIFKSLPPEFFFICLLYLAIAILHIYFTGFLFAHWWFKYFNAQRKEKNIHLELIDEYINAPQGAAKNAVHPSGYLAYIQPAAINGQIILNKNIIIGCIPAVEFAIQNHPDAIIRANLDTELSNFNSIPWDISTFLPSIPHSIIKENGGHCFYSLGILSDDELYSIYDSVYGVNHDTALILTIFLKEFQKQTLIRNLAPMKFTDYFNNYQNILVNKIGVGIIS